MSGTKGVIEMKIDPEDMSRRNTHELIMSAIVPRPVALVSTVGEDGVFNLAPYSGFYSLALKPTLVGINFGWTRDGRTKDTLRNIEFSKEFVVNVVTETMAEVMNQTSAEYPSDVDEFKEVGLTPIKADIVKSPMVAESPVNMECKLVQIMQFGESPIGSQVAIGQVVLVHVKDELWSGEYIEPSRLKAIARIGGRDSYCRTRDIFKMDIYC